MTESCLCLRGVTAVLLELPRIGEASVTLLARVELLACVDLQVGLELIGLVELPMTERTLKGLLPRVDPHVPVEVSVRSEGLAALVTFVRLLACVNALVLLQTSSVEKPLSAHVANKRLLARVAPLMIAERVFVMERLPADAAVELFVLAVAFFVKFERARGTEAFQAYFAAVWFNQRLVLAASLEEILRAVRLLVPVGMHVPLMYLQPAVEEEGLPAQVAHKRLSGAMDEHVGLELVVV